MAALKKKKTAVLKKKKTVIKKPKVLRGSVRKNLRASKKPAVISKRITSLKRFSGNPIIKPGVHAWEQRATFNPTAMEHEGKVHLLYRAIGSDDRSTLGYAGSHDGRVVHERLREPAYDLRATLPRGVLPRIPYSSGGGTSGGCEDPRMTRIGDRVYVIYTAFDGWGSLRLSLTSIDLNDFLEKRWRWRKPVLISPPGQINKNWVLFPEKIHGKFALLHSIFNGIQIAYIDSLDDYFDGQRFIDNSTRYGQLVPERWDSQVRGAGPPPLRTEKGWLLLYHAVDHRDPGRYKLGAMLLDLDDPTKILYRCRQPILEPNAPYENEGFKSGLVYSCGAVIKNGELIVYYGGADMVTCVASADLKTFIDELIATGRPVMTRRAVLNRLSS